MIKMGIIALYEKTLINMKTTMTFKNSKKTTQKIKSGIIKKKIHKISNP